MIKQAFIKGEMAKDSGYAWVICSGAFVLNFINSSINSSFSVILTDFVDTFGVNMADASFASSLSAGMMCLSGM